MDGVFARVFAALFGTLSIFSAGCTSIDGSQRHLVKGSIPASQVSCELTPRSRRDMVPIDFTLLQQPMPAEHIIGPRDVLGVYIEDVLDQSEQLPQVNFAVGSDPVFGLQSPSVGHPIRVELNGTIQVPYIDPVNVSGMNMALATTAIRQAYLDAKIINSTTTKVSVSLIRPRTYSVVVMREDSGGTGVIGRSVQILSQRGTGDAIELPAFKNDVLHALTATGGLPGEDASNEVWIFRNSQSGSGVSGWSIMQQLRDGPISDELILQNENLLRIPLRVPCGAPPTFAPSDVILNDGDVVYVSLREQEYFVGAGLIQGGKYILPRDHDTDIFDAIAIANTSALGPAGTNAGQTVFRNGPGNIIAPSRVIVVRRLPGDQQTKIEVDLRVAANDPRERLIVQPGDILILRYRPMELVGNTMLNIINLGFAIPNN